MSKISAKYLRWIILNTSKAPTGVVAKMASELLKVKVRSRQMANALLTAQQELVDARRRARDAERARNDQDHLVLVVFPTGEVRLYGERWHNVKTVLVPKGEGEQYLEDLLDTSPQRWSEVAWPNKVRVTTNVLWCPRPEKLEEAECVARLITGLNDFERKVGSDANYCSSRVSDDSNVQDGRPEDAGNQVSVEAHPGESAGGSE